MTYPLNIGTIRSSWACVALGAALTVTSVLAACGDDEEGVSPSVPDSGPGDTGTIPNDAGGGRDTSFLGTPGLDPTFGTNGVTVLGGAGVLDTAFGTAGNAQANAGASRDVFTRVVAVPNQSIVAISSAESASIRGRWTFDPRRLHPPQLVRRRLLARANHSLMGHASEAARASGASGS